MLGLVAEDDVGPDPHEALAQALGAEPTDHIHGREVDADPRTMPTGELDGTLRCGSDRLAHQRVARQMKPLGALEPFRFELAGVELGCDAAVGDHRPAAVELDERHDDAVPLCRRWAEHLDGPAEQVRFGHLARRIGAALADESRLRAVRCGPGSDVRRLAAAADSGVRSRVVTPGQWLRELDDDVEEEIPEGANDHASMLP